MLSVRDLSVRYGPITAVNGVSLEVPAGEMRAIFGANGAGKSTIMKAIVGLLKPSGGSVELPKGTPIGGQPAHQAARRGIGFVPEGRQVLGSLTVRENLEMGGYVLRESKTLKRNLERAFDTFPRLKEREQQLAGTLSGGEQQQLAIARALMADPKILLLDEPSLGLAPIVVRDVFRVIRQINAAGMTMLLVEQNVKAAMSMIHWGYVLESGRVVVQGPPHDLARDPAVQRAYLGG